MATVPRIDDANLSFDRFDANAPFAIDGDQTGYDGGADELRVVIGPGRARWGAVVYELAADQTTFVVSAPTASTTYHVYLDYNAGSPAIIVVTTGPADAEGEWTYLGTVVTDTDTSVASTTDERGLLPVPPVPVLARLEEESLSRDAEQNVRIWQLESDVIGSVEGFTGWTGDGFLVGQDEVASNTGLLVNRTVDLDTGFAGLRESGVDSWTEQTTPLTNDDLNEVTYGGGQWVAAGGDGEILTSPDAESWTLQNTGVADLLYGVAYGDGKYVAVGASGTVITSPDAETWAGQTTPTTTFLREVMWSDTQSKWVAVGASGTVITSPDAETWTEYDVGTTQTLEGLAHDGSKWAVAYAEGNIATSPDAQTWTVQSTPVSANLKGVAYGDGLWVATGDVGDDGTIITSPDAVTWTQQTPPNFQNMLGVHRGSDVWLIVGNTGDIWSSPDAVTWTAQPAPNNNYFSAWQHGTTWVVVGDSGTVLTALAGSANDATVTLTTITLEEAATDVYLLAEVTADAGVTETYEATLDGGTTWDTLTIDETTTLNHSGTQFAIRFRHQRTDGTDESSVFWIIGYAT